MHSDRREAHVRRITLFMIALVLAQIGSAAVALPSAAGIDRVVQRNVAEGFSGSVLVAMGDRILLNRGYGSVRGVRMRPNTRYWISSMGKQFVAAAILLLEERGKLGLNDPILRWLPEAPADKRAITIKQLLSHTSGILQGYEGEKSSSNAEAVRRILTVPLETSRANAFHYSNENYQLAAAIVERASGLSVQQFERRTFFQPLHMNDTGIAQGPAGVAPTRDPTPARLLKPNWGIEGHYSTAHDLFRWARALSEGRVLSPNSLQELWTPVVPIQEGQAALGWFVTTMPSGTRRIWTRGNDDFGPNSLLYTYPQRSLVIVILTHAGQKTDDVSYSRALIADLERTFGL
jgi:CubicO group peptidase (beta-lactamase class C family)